MIRVQQVKASGDKTGVTDTAAITTAINKARAPSGGNKEQGTVLLVGDCYFYVNSCIVNGDPKDNTVKPVNIIGGSHAVIEYVGNTTNNYLIGVYGNSYAPGPRVGNLFLRCNGKSRGVLMHRQIYQSDIENITIHQARQVGIDFISSYKSSARNIHCWYCDGVSLRIWYSQGCVIDNVRIASNSVTTWPDVIDEHLEDVTGNKVTMRISDRAPVYIHSQDVVLRSFMVENSTLKDYPAITIFGMYSRGVHFREQMYFEKVTSNHSLIYIPCSFSVKNIAGQDFLFENVSKHGAEIIPSFIKCSGLTDYLRVHGIRGTAINGSGFTNVIQCDGNGSKLYRAEVKGARVGIQSSRQIVGTNQGSIESGEPYGLTFDPKYIEHNKKVIIDPINSKIT